MAALDTCLTVGCQSCCPANENPLEMTAGPEHLCHRSHLGDAMLPKHPCAALGSFCSLPNWMLKGNQLIVVGGQSNLFLSAKR